MTATVTGGGTGTASGSGAASGTGTPPGSLPPARRAARPGRLGFLRASTTPGKFRLIRAGLVLGCLAWGALAALMVGQHASAARDAASTSEPLSLAAQQMYQSLVRADQAVFADGAAAGSGAFTGLQAGVSVLAVIMAAGCAWGLSRRLAEYR
jgi:hypothetical protein